MKCATIGCDNQADELFCDSCQEMYENIYMPSLLNEATIVNSFQEKVSNELRSIGNMLVEKNNAYGNSALEPKRIFSKVDNIEQINVRIDDKLSRIANGDTSEDSELDLIGYLILKRMAKA